MMVQAESLHQRLSSVLNPFSLEVIDESADHAGHVGANDLGFGTHFRVRIGCSQFNGLSRVKRHRLVYMRCKISSTKDCTPWPSKLLILPRLDQIFFSHPPPL